MLNTILLYVLYFFFYSACGWFIESCYCSVRPRKWINRGFLYGPMCPIYGSGALLFAIALGKLSQLPFYFETEHYYFSKMPIAVFFLGAILADVLEFFTSLIMEKLFHARWWDYSKKKLNIQGRICLSHTIYWGVIAVVFLFFIHPFVSEMILKIPLVWRNAVTYAVLVVFLFDLVMTVKKTADFRKLFDKMDKLSALIKEKGVSARGKGTAAMGDLSAELREQFDAVSEYWRKLLAQTKENSTSFSEQITEKAKKSKAKKNRFMRSYPDFRRRVTQKYEEFKEIVDMFRQ